MLPSNSAEIVERVNANAFVYFASSHSETKLTQREDITRYVSGLPHYIANTVLMSDIEPEQLVDSIAEVVADYQALNVPGGWFIQTLPSNDSLRAELERAGFRKLFENPGMIADLSALELDEELPTEISVKMVENLSDLKDWSSVLTEVFHLPDELQGLFTDPFRIAGFGPEQKLRAYLAYFNGVPVATSSLYCDEGVGGIFCVSTLKSARGKGLGRAVTQAAMVDAHQLGLKFAILQSSEIAISVYKKLGFEECGMFERWVINM